MTFSRYKLAKRVVSIRVTTVEIIKTLLHLWSCFRDHIGGTVLQLIDPGDPSNLTNNYLGNTLRIKGKSGQLHFDARTIIADNYFFKINYFAKEPLITPNLLVQINDNSTEVHVFQNDKNNMLFGICDFSFLTNLTSAAIVLSPSKIDCDIRINSFRIYPINSFRKKLYDQPLFWETMIHGFWSAIKSFIAKHIAFWKRSPEGNINNYSDWWKYFGQAGNQQLAQQSKQWRRLPKQPEISILLSINNCEDDLIRSAVESVIAQTYPNWQLCIVHSDAWRLSTQTILQNFAASDNRIVLVKKDFRQSKKTMLRETVDIATGTYCGLLKSDATLAPQALYLLVEYLDEHPKIRLVYSDEDIINDKGIHCEGIFKPDWNPDLFRSNNYIGNTVFLESQLLKKTIKECRSVSSEVFELLVRVTGGLVDQEILHIPKVLYHSKHYNQSLTSECKRSAQSRRLEELDVLKKAFSEQGETVKISLSEIDLGFRIKYATPNPSPSVSIIIPTKNLRNMLSNCVDSVLNKTTYDNYEIIIIDNQSNEPESLDYLRDINQHSSVKVISYDRPFNYSAINNFGVKYAIGDILLFLNNDTEVINGDWLCEMVSQASRKEIGAVGAKLFFGDQHIQHAGVVLGFGPENIAGHPYRCMHKYEIGPLGRLRLVQNYSALTAACLAIRREVFKEVKGFNEKDLKISFNDVDLCLKLREAGFRNLWTPYAQLYHFESISRSYKSKKADQARLDQEINYLKKRWGRTLSYDPAHNPNLNLDGNEYVKTTYSLNKSLKARIVQKIH